MSVTPGFAVLSEAEVLEFKADWAPASSTTAKNSFPDSDLAALGYQVGGERAQRDPGVCVL
jgi:hypothetical protein